MNYLIFYLQFHKKVTEVAFRRALKFGVNTKKDEGRVFIRETAEKGEPLG